MSETIHRKIIHIDMGVFYASVEQRDFPQYKGKALIVGGMPEGRGRVVATGPLPLPGRSQSLSMTRTGPRSVRRPIMLPVS
ncbi:hypothetical protein SAMN05192529_11132 [Arachidicoccus rhizosphaerae]|uniref:UmuC domain-containing protein n=1 Tax=Arachidicoccus rhizosphaerae TaxID=551991 RepID=A0A1H3ZHN9_9BACT|nr:hypothetical protein [Arachidicoccus rhizosphaerae]SEA23177.1 hypothetical protein SAMN05192529_11132 [Arachidicoccus rhizosphaerae]